MSELQQIQQLINESNKYFLNEKNIYQMVEKSFLQNSDIVSSKKQLEKKQTNSLLKEFFTPSKLYKDTLFWCWIIFNNQITL